MKKLLFLIIPLFLNASLDTPSNLVLIPDKTSVKLNWSDNSDSETGFKIFRDDNLVGVTPADNTTFVDRGLKPTTLYRYTIKATDDLNAYNLQADTKSWYIYSNSQENALEKVYDTTLNKDVVSLKTTNGKSIAMQLDSNWSDERSIITWEQKIKGSYKIYLKINTTKGNRYIVYEEGATDKGLYDEEYLTVGLPSLPSDSWQSITRDIEADLKRVESDNDFISVDRFLIRIYDEGRLGLIALSENSKNSGEVSSDFISIVKKTEGVEIASIKSNRENVIQNDSKLFDISLENLSTHKIDKIDSLSGWSSVAVDKTSTQIKITFSMPKSESFPSTLQVIAYIDIVETTSKWHVEISGVGEEYSIVDIDAPKLRFKVLNSGKFLIPKYTGKLIDVENEVVDRDMLYPAGWQSTMQFLAYYNDNIGIYLGNHDPKASTKRFKVVKKDGVIEYSTKLIPPNKTLANNDFNQSGVFELDSFSGDWYEASLIYRTWAEKEAEYWPVMTDSRIKRQHKIGEVALWANCMYITAIENSNRTRENKDKLISEYLTHVKDILTDYASHFPDIGLGVFWQEWYGKLHDTNFPSVFFPLNDEISAIKQMMTDIKLTYPNVQFMPYINGLLYNIYLPDYIQEAALRYADGNVVMYYPDGKKEDANRTEKHFARMDPTQVIWQDTIRDAADVVLNKIDADSLHIDQVTASNAIEDMATNHNHPLAGGHWWRDGYNDMFTKIDSVAKDGQYITSEGANEFLSNHVDGFFLHWSGVDNMVAAYQAVYSGKMQLFGMQMDESGYSEDRFYMQYAQAFTHGIQLGIVTTYITLDDREGASRAFSFVKNLSILRYNLREFLSYGQMQKDLVLRGDIPTLSATITDAQARTEPDGVDDGTIEIHMPAIEHAVYKNETGDKVAFIFTNASLKDSISFSFDIDPALYGLKDNLSLIKMDYEGSKEDENINGKTTKSVTLKPLDSVVFIVSNP